MAKLATVLVHANIGDSPNETKIDVIELFGDGQMRFHSESGITADDIYKLLVKGGEDA